MFEISRERVFSASHQRRGYKGKCERLHGHNFRVRATIDCVVDDDGLAFDYGVYKRLLAKLCHDWNEYFLLPAKSEHLTFEGDDTTLQVVFGDERIPFLRRDVLLLPVSNVTIEELSWLMTQRLVDVIRPEDRSQISAVTVAVFSGPGQSASTTQTVEDEPK